MRVKPKRLLKISNRCQHKQHKVQTHILSKFTRQFAPEDSSEKPVAISTEEEWSASSNFDSSSDDSECDGACERDGACESAQCDFSRRSGSVIRSTDPEDHAQGFSRTSAAASSKGTEFFELSPS